MLKTGFIGVGSVAQLMHLPILMDLNDKFKTTAISDVSPTLREHISKQFNTEAYESPLELIEKADVDVVFVLSPDQYHAELAGAAIKAGKHVFIEKPAALCLNDLDDLIAIHNKYKDSKVMVGYMRRYAGNFLKCKELIQEDKNRKISYLRCRDIICEAPFYVGQTRPRLRPQDAPDTIKNEAMARRKAQEDLAVGSDASAEKRILYKMLTGLGCHTLSAVRELVGAPREVKSVTYDGQHLIITFQFDGFIGLYELVNDQDIVQFDASIEVFQNDRLLKVKYETPYIRYQPHCLEVIESTKIDTKTTMYGPDYRDAFVNEINEFYKCITSNILPKTSLEDARFDSKLFKEIISKI